MKIDENTTWMSLNVTQCVSQSVTCFKSFNFFYQSSKCKLEFKNVLVDTILDKMLLIGNCSVKEETFVKILLQKIFLFKKNNGQRRFISYSSIFLLKLFLATIFQISIFTSSVLIHKTKMKIKFSIFYSIHKLIDRSTSCQCDSVTLFDFS